MIGRIAISLVAFLWTSTAYAQCPGSASPCETFSTFMNNTSTAGARTPADRVPYIQGTTKYLVGPDVASTASVQNGSYVWGGTSIGSPNAQLIMLAPPITLYQAGQKFSFKAGFSNTGAMTLDAGHGAVALYKQTATGPQPMTGGEIAANNIALVEYNGTQFVLLSSTPVSVYPSVLDYGASSTATDNSAAFKAAFDANCGKPLTVPPQQFAFTNPVSSNCSPIIYADGATFKDNVDPSSPTPLWTFSGTQGLPTALTVNSTQFTLTVASPAGFCQPSDGLPDPNCAVLVWDTNTWDPTFFSHNPGEIKLIRAISGSTITLFSPLNALYQTTFSAQAAPVAFTQGLRVNGGTFVGPNVDSAREAIAGNLCWDAKVWGGAKFVNYGGEGSVIWDDCQNFEETGNFYIGLGAVSTGAFGDNYLSVVVDASEGGDIHDNQYFNGGPCFTIADSSTAPGTTRHVKFHDNWCYSLGANNSYAIQGHFQGDGIEIYNNTVDFASSLTLHTKGISFATPGFSVHNNHIYNVAGPAIFMENGTNQVGPMVITNNDIHNPLQHCILVSAQIGTSTGGFDQLIIDGNRGDRCGEYGIEYTGGVISPENVSISNNNLFLIGAGFIGIYTNQAVNNFGVDHNIIRLSNPTDRAIYLTDPGIATVDENKIHVAAGNTREGITLQGSALGACSHVSVSNNMLNSGSDVSGVGVSFSNNCTNWAIGWNDTGGFTTAYHLSSGTGGHITSPLFGVTGAILPVAGACATGTAPISGALSGTGQSATAVGTVYPGDNVNATAEVGSSSVTVHVCAAAGSTPVSTTYRVSLSQGTQQ